MAVRGPALVQGHGYPTARRVAFRDPFGLPPAGATRTVVTIPGSHSLRSPINVTPAVSGWLAATVIA